MDVARYKALARNKSSRLPRVACSVVVAAIIAVVLIGTWVGPIALLQASLNGTVVAAYLGVGAMGLTLLMAVVRTVNLAHGDMMVAGAYGTAFLALNGLPIPMAGPIAVAGVAAVALMSEWLIWRPMRNASAGKYRMLLAAIGLGLVIRHAIQFVAGGGVRTLGNDVLSTVALGPLRLGTGQAVVLATGIATTAAVWAILQVTKIGEDMRAHGANAELAEVSGIDTRRTAAFCWILAGCLAGIAGVLYAGAVGSFSPNFGLPLLLGLFAAAVLGGVGNVLGAALGGLVVGLTQEWTALLFGAGWRQLATFVLLIALLVAMPSRIPGGG